MSNCERKGIQSPNKPKKKGTSELQRLVHAIVRSPCGNFATKIIDQYASTPSPIALEEHQQPVCKKTCARKPMHVI